MSRTFTFTLATLLSASVAVSAWAQRAGNTGSSTGPSQSGAAGNSSAGPAQTGAAGTAAGPAQTGAAGQQGQAGQIGTQTAPGGQNTINQQQNPQQFQQQQQQLNQNQNANQLNNRRTDRATSVRQRPWFNNPRLRQEMRMTDDQFRQLDQGYQGAWTRYNQGVLGLRNNLNQQDRMRQLRELRQNFNTDFGRSLDTNLADRAIRDRYNQLNMQYQGFDAFSDPAVQQRLRLTPEQRQQFERFAQEWQEQLLNLEQTYPTDQQQATQRYNQMREQIAMRIYSILNPQQRTLWGQMTGVPVQFDATDFFFQGGDPHLRDTIQQTPAQLPGSQPVQPATNAAPRPFGDSNTGPQTGQSNTGPQTGQSNTGTNTGQSNTGPKTGNSNTDTNTGTNPNSAPAGQPAPGQSVPSNIPPATPQ